MSVTENPSFVAASERKQRGNELLGEGHFLEAAAEYLQGVSLLKSAFDNTPETDDAQVRRLAAVLYANTAAARISSETLGSAYADAKCAIAADDSYAKGHYRAAMAALGLCKYKEAERHMHATCVRDPKNRVMRAKYAEVKKLRKRIEFEAAIAVEDAHPFKDLTLPLPIGKDALPNQPFLEGPDSAITADFVMQLVAWVRDDKRIDKYTALRILTEVRPILRGEPTLVEWAHSDSPSAPHVTLCGDVHGQLFDFLHIFDKNGFPSESNPYLFNGDFVDRGSWSVEIILLLFAWKVVFPKQMLLNRGNHETKRMNQIYGFFGEVKAKLGESVQDLFADLFQALPLATVLTEARVFICHGGLFSMDGVMLSDVAKLDRFSEPPDSGIFCDLLWADPAPDGETGRLPSPRGTSVQFGQDVTHDFCDRNNLKAVVRSHQVRDDGFTVEHGSKLITIFSAPNYCDNQGNKAAFINCKADGEMKFTQFEAQPHPNTRPMAYASMGMGMF
uniref:Serine/threonine-protein phosphatase n=1 Tax=Sexangularia sp. CB-2014 TaxID=1486929 RepID=A0A7S1V932_9EUKA|mmetsp:Transcript_14204/g.44720  ORF Transcript_14204/g.44720 Transcript_14204/m.44720 type:complete len:504 (+) Transcript_14204:107-1618(+)